MNKFRVHHIMCTNLYKGYGYSGPFCENMTKMVSWLNENQDEKLLEPLKLSENKTYTYRQLKEHAQKYLTKEVFEKSCSNCEWYDKGLCRYEDFDWK